MVLALCFIGAPKTIMVLSKLSVKTEDVLSKSPNLKIVFNKTESNDYSVPV